MIAIRRVACALASTLILAAAVDVAPAAAVSDRVKRACAGDYKRLCPRYKVGSNALRACMEAKQAEISSGCVQALIDSGEVNRGRGRR